MEEKTIQLNFEDLIENPKHHYSSKKRMLCHYKRCSCCGMMEEKYPMDGGVKIVAEAWVYGKGYYICQDCLDDMSNGVVMDAREQSTHDCYGARVRTYSTLAHIQHYYPITTQYDFEYKPKGHARGKIK